MKSKQVREIELKPIKETRSDFDALEDRLKKYFRETIYYPLMRELALKRKVLKNSIDDLYEAIRDGEIFFSRGQFRGKFGASISRELRELGATWDKKNSAWKIRLSELPVEIQGAIRGSDFAFKEKLDRIDEILHRKSGPEISTDFRCSDLFDRTLWKTDNEFQSTIKGITIAPRLTKEQRKKISDEWQENMNLWIKDFKEEEILKLRKSVQEAAFKGNRRESLLSTIQKSYGVSSDKAKFLARQETSLLMTKYKETRYRDAGCEEYIWGCVSGSKLHPVRPAHKRLEGKRFRWDDPPITTEAGQPARKNNPGQDYNCRCFAKPIVRMTKSEDKK